MARQLPLSLPLREALGREDFLVAPANALAVRAVDDWAGWPEGKLALIGPAGAGKTHLAQVWAGEVSAEVVPAATLHPDMLEGLAAQGRVVVEDAHAVAGLAERERALFHLHNMVRAAQGNLLLTARLPPNRWALALPDLASRMQATATASLHPPDDALLAAVLIKLFNDRQITVSPALIRYLVARMERSFAAARQLVATLDARALAEGRPVTRALAAEVLDTDRTDTR